MNWEFDFLMVINSFLGILRLGNGWILHFYFAELDMLGFFLYIYMKHK